MEEYKFDLLGYTVIRQALDPDHVRAINDWINALPPLTNGQWYGNIEVHTYGGIDGMNLQNIIEGGEIFERLIDHPSWIESVSHYIGKSHSPYINEAFLNLRGPGGYIGLHSGGHSIDHHQRSGRNRGKWVCTLITLILALTDVGPGDGATVVIPGSHKSDFPHPMQDVRGDISQGSGDAVECGAEIHLSAGDAFLFNDALCHGSTQRTNEGQRRVIIFRYVPSLYAHRFGYVPSNELLSRLTPERHAILQPITPHRPPITRVNKENEDVYF